MDFKASKNYGNRNPPALSITSQRGAQSAWQEKTATREKKMPLPEGRKWRGRFICDHGRAKNSGGRVIPAVRWWGIARRVGEVEAAARHPRPAKMKRARPVACPSGGSASALWVTLQHRSSDAAPYAATHLHSRGPLAESPSEGFGIGIRWR